MHTAPPRRIERLSIELTNVCSKACAFCYNRSGPGGTTHWPADEVVALVKDCARHGTRAVSFGGGEPLEYPGIFDVLRALERVLFRSVTTNGLPLRDAATFERLVASRPDKVHVSIHYPDDDEEVARVAAQVGALESRGIRAGVNFLVDRGLLESGRRAAARLRSSGIGNDRTIFLPRRGEGTPGADEVGQVAGGECFQATSCLLSCGPSPRFCALAWDRTVAWCSYTSARAALPAPSFDALMSTLDSLEHSPCGGLR